MNQRSMIPISFLAAPLATALLCAFLPLTIHAAERVEHKELPATAGGTLTFKTVSGGIEIKTHDKDVVTYDAVVKPGRGIGGGNEMLEALEFEYENDKGNVNIAMKWKDDKRPRTVSLNARHTLLIPARYNIDVRTAGGTIDAGEIDGKVVAQTSGGNIRFGKINGDIKAHTSGGNVEVESVQGDVEVKTSGGNIQVGNVHGELKGSTSGGSITAALDKQIDKPLDLNTSGGNIKLAVPADFKADLSARTAGGNVNCDLQVDGEVKRSAINGKINGGGPRVTLHTSGGNIKVGTR